jgi:hypothetical protein
MSRTNPFGYGQGLNAPLLDDDVDGDADISSIIRTNRGAGRAPTRRMSDYRRSNRFTEDGYGDSDFS